MNVCIYVYIDVCLHGCTHVCMCSCLHVCMYVCMSVCIYVCMYVCMCVSACRCARVHECISIHLYVYVYVLVNMLGYVCTGEYVCICIVAPFCFRKKQLYVPSVFEYCLHVHVVRTRCPAQRGLCHLVPQVERIRGRNEWVAYRRDRLLALLCGGALLLGGLLRGQVDDLFSDWVSTCKQKYYLKVSGKRLVQQKQATSFFLF